MGNSLSKGVPVKVLDLPRKIITKALTKQRLKELVTNNLSVEKKFLGGILHLTAFWDL